jgi:uncharacterized membrane protein YphA (DoxX/SURF4 family)
MRLPKARTFPIRLATGTFILSSGLDKRVADEDTATHLHDLTVGTYPVARAVSPRTFTKYLAAGEIALGTALLLPVVPTAVAGVGLATFAVGLLGLYARTPGMRRPGSLRPTQQGIPVAQDIWILGAGIGLVVDALTDRAR